jgi:hypothetical protein
MIFFNKQTLKSYLPWQEKQKRLKREKGFCLSIVNPDAAGIDVSDTEMQVYRIFGVNLMRIPGISEGSVLNINRGIGT